jgi:integrase
MEEIPTTLKKTLDVVKERVSQLNKQYHSLANWGRPYIFSVDEGAVIYYLNAKLNVSADKLAKYLNVDKTSVYKMIKRIENENRLAIYNEELKRVDVITVTPYDLISRVEELLNISSRQRVIDPLQSSIIKEFMSKNIERQSNRERRAYYNDNEKLESVKVVKEIMEYLAQKGEVSNPDFWTKESLLKTLDEMYKDIRVKRDKIKLLRRIPHFRDWLEGYVGAEKRFITPKISAIYFTDYLKIKDLLRRGEITEQEFLVIWLHLTVGCREGWGSEGVSTSQDLDTVNTSLIGLKWENIQYTSDTIILKAYENKTQKWWSADLKWLDPEPVELLLKYRKDKGSIVKTLSGCKTVVDFQRWYSRTLKKISKLLNLPFELTPHDMRRSHISILAELGVPMEVAVSGLMDFGVGWEDLSTALIFYTRFSRYAKVKIIENINTRKQEILKSLT